MKSTIDIMNISTPQELRLLKPEYLQYQVLTDEEFDHIFKLCDALWLRPEDPAAPHVGLSAGGCSDGFVDVLRVLRFTNLCQIMARQLILRHWEGDLQADWVVGSDHAGAALSHSVAIQLSATHDFSEKGPNKSQQWKRFQIGPQEKVLQVEELVTTTNTLDQVRQGIRQGNSTSVEFYPMTWALVHRSSTYEFEGSPILFARHYEINKWDSPEACPLCQAGSKRINQPKKHWAELTGKL